MVRVPTPGVASGIVQEISPILHGRAVAMPGGIASSRRPARADEGPKHQRYVRRSVVLPLRTLCGNSGRSGTIAIAADETIG